MSVDAALLNPDQPSARKYGKCPSQVGLFLNQRHPRSISGSCSRGQSPISCREPLKNGWSAPMREAGPAPVLHWRTPCSTALRKMCRSGLRAMQWRRSVAVGLRGEARSVDLQPDLLDHLAEALVVAAYRFRVHLARALRGFQADADHFFADL